jgi:hypothetical protein
MMPLDQYNTRLFHWNLFSGQIQTVTLLKRNDDQQEGTVTAYTLYGCWRSRMTKGGQQIQGDMTADHQTVWHVPRNALLKAQPKAGGQTVLISYLNNLDRIIDDHNRWWQPESDLSIDIALMEGMVKVICHRRDPNPNVVQPVTL